MKGKERAREKMNNDYGGKASQLKDLTRLTLQFDSCSQMSKATKELQSEKAVELGFRVVQVKNKYASPTPMG